MAARSLIRCNACQQGKHRDCTITTAIAEYRINYVRCQCDRFHHKLPKHLTCNVATQVEYD